MYIIYIIYKYIYIKITHNLFKNTNISLLFRSFVNVNFLYKQKYK